MISYSVIMEQIPLAQINLVYQGNCFHEYETRRYAFSNGKLVDNITLYVFLPFGETGFDYNWKEKLEGRRKRASGEGP